MSDTATDGETPRPILLSWSGGKDSAWALHALRQDPHWLVCGLVTTLTEGYDRISIHGLRREILLAQAEAADLPVIEAWIPPQADNATYEAAFANALAVARMRCEGMTLECREGRTAPAHPALAALAHPCAAEPRAAPELSHIAFGDLFLADVRAYREALCARIGWTPVFPLFGSDTSMLAREMIDGGLRATLCCVDTTQLDADWVGREFDRRLLADLPVAVDPCGERGEFHTCVPAGPMFSRTLDLVRGERVLRDGRFMYCDLQLSPTAPFEASDESDDAARMA